MTSEEQIEEILLEAHAYGLWKEVLTTATSIMEAEPTKDRVTAFEEAFNEWVK